MNISVDPAVAKRDTHALLTSHFDAYAAQASDLDEFRDALVAICEANKETSWDVLALLDQYQRRGVLDAQTAKNMKTRISHIVFGMPMLRARHEEQTDPSPGSERPVVRAPEETSPAVEESPEPEAPVSSPRSQSSSTPELSEPPASKPRSPLPDPSKSAPVIAKASPVVTEKVDVPTDRSTKSNGLDPRWKQRVARRLQDEFTHARQKAQETLNQDFDEPAADRSPVDLAQPDEDFFRQTGTEWPKIETPATVARDAAVAANEAIRQQAIAKPALDSSVWVLTDVEPRPAETAAASIVAPTATTQSDSSPPAVGQTLSGRYVLKQLQSQRNGIFYFKALDLHRDKFTETERYVGIKLIYLSNDTQTGELARLESEFRKMQQLAHPNILKVFDLDHDGNRHFITTQWLPGIKLSELLLPLGTEVLARRHALTLIHSVGSALAHAHEQGIVHGDLHPDHVLLTETGDIKLNGFAFDAAEWQEPAFDSQPAAVVSARNTLAYASCERLAGAGVDERSDVYSLAVLSYQLLAGRHPFNGLLATQARDERRKPARVAGLNALQWRALRRALTWTRSKRSSSVRDLLRELGAQNATDRLPSLAQVQSAARSAEPAHWRAAMWLVACIALVAAAAIVAVRRDPSLVASGSAKNELTTSVATEPAPTIVPSKPSVKSSSAAPSHREPVQAATPPHHAIPEEPSTPTEAPAIVPPPATSIASQPPAPTAAAPTPTPVPVPVPVPTVAAPAAHGGPGVLSFTEDTYSVGPGEGMARINVKRRSGTRGPVSFRWWTVPGSAQANADYVPVESRVEEMSAGQDKATLVVPVVADATRRHTEYFEVQIADPEGGMQLGENARATVILIASQ
jgi:serine/threonine protein kinase